MNMKSLKESLFDSELVSKDTLFHPKTKDELKNIIKEQLKIQGPDANLNIIDVSKIDDMGELFYARNFKINIKNINISDWNVSNVKNMEFMFLGCEKFNCDLSKWDVSNVKNMRSMFVGCEKFNSDLSNWNVSKVTNMQSMFGACKIFNSDLSKWDVGNVETMEDMFYDCKNFNSDLSKWNVNMVKNMCYMFDGCKSLKKIPSWYEES